MEVAKADVIKASRHPRFRLVGVEHYLLPGSTHRHRPGLGLHVIVVHAGLTDSDRLPRVHSHPVGPGALLDSRGVVVPQPLIADQRLGHVGGIGGLSAALALRFAGAKVRVYEQASELG